MKRNVGKIDKTIRLIIAVVAIYFAYKWEFEANWTNYILYAIGAIMIITTLFSFCPLYAVFGLKTSSKKH